MLMFFEAVLIFTLLTEISPGETAVVSHRKQTLQENETFAQGAKSRYYHRQCKAALDRYASLPECHFSWNYAKKYALIYEDSILKNVYMNKSALLQEIDKYLYQYYSLGRGREGSELLSLFHTMKNWSKTLPREHVLNTRCELGPDQFNYTVSDAIFWPPIKQSLCKGQGGCNVPGCYHTKQRKTDKCVLVLVQCKDHLHNVGYRRVKYKEDVSCECKSCKHLKSIRECINTYPVPNQPNQFSYCIWNDTKKVEHCENCFKKNCTGFKTFNHLSCQCECPIEKSVHRCPSPAYWNITECRCLCLDGKIPQWNENDDPVCQQAIPCSYYTTRKSCTQHHQPGDPSRPCLPTDSSCSSKPSDDDGVDYPNMSKKGYVNKYYRYYKKHKGRRKKWRGGRRN